MPEKTLAELPRNQRELYDKGNAALQKRNYDYAIAIYNQILLHEPGFYPGREALRACQFAKSGSGSSGFFKRVLGTASASPLLAKAQVQVRTNPAEALATCEQILNGDPNNVPAHKLLAEAATALDFPKSAVLSLEIAFKNSNRDVEIGKRLAEALIESGQIERSQEIYNELQSLKPGDPEIAQSLKNVAARLTMRDQGYEGLQSGQGSYRDILKDKKEAAALEQEQRQVKSEDVAAQLIRDHLARLEKEPNDRRLLREVAELYSQLKQFDTALEFYGRIQAAEGQADPSLERAIVETRLRQMDERIAQLDPSAPDYSEHRAALEKERQEFEITEARRRVEKQPNDLAFRYELGVLLFQAGQVRDAIQEFQKSQHNPNKKIPSLYHLGLCFTERKMFDFAVRAFENAIAEKPAMDSEKKELIYSLGLALEKSGKNTEAIEQFKKIYEVDIGYKDVAAKVDAFYAAHH